MARKRVFIPPAPFSRNKNSSLFVPNRFKDAAPIQPWKVTLWVVDFQETDEARPVTYFVRCHDGKDAGAVANALWVKWERWPALQKQFRELGLDTEEDHSKYRPFPFPDTRGHGTAVALDEGDWQGFLKSGIKYGREKALSSSGKQVYEIHWAGDIANPGAFTITGLTFSDEMVEGEQVQQKHFVDADLKGGLAAGTLEKPED